MGKIPQHKARADFTTGFMEVAAFEVLKNDGLQPWNRRLRLPANQALMLALFALPMTPIPSWCRRLQN